MNRITKFLLLNLILLPIFFGFMIKNGSLSYSDYHGNLQSEYFNYSSFFSIWSNKNYGNPSIQQNIVMISHITIQYLLTDILPFGDWIIIYLSFFFLLISSSYLFRVMGLKDSFSYVGATLMVYSPFSLAFITYGWTIVSLLPIGASFLIIAFYINYLKTKKNKYFIFSILASMLAFILIQFALLAYVVLLIYTIVYFRNKISRYLLFCLLSILLSSWWLLPFIVLTFFYQYSHYSSNLHESLDFFTKDFSFVEFISMKNITAGGNKSYGFLHEIISIIINFTFITLSHFLLLKNKNMKDTLFLSSTILLFTILSFGGNTVIYRLLFEYFPFFYIFRDISKFLPMLFFFIILVLIKEYQDILFKDKAKSVLFSLLIVLMIANSWPLYSGNIGGIVSEIELPKYYTEYFKFERSELIDKRGLILPIPNLYSYFDFYNSYQMHNPIKTHSKSNIIYDEFFGSNLKESNKNLIESMFNDQCNIKNLLDNYSINYILVQNDQLISFQNTGTNKDLFNKTSYDYQSKLKNSGLKYTYKNFGDLDLFILEESKQSKNIYVSNNISVVSTIEELYSQICDEKASNLLVVASDLKNKEITTLSDILPEITYKKLFPFLYKVEMSEKNDNFILTLNENYNAGWRIFSFDTNIKNVFHFKSKGFSNSWYFSEESIDDLKNCSETKCDLRLYVFYFPQIYFYLGSILSILVGILIIFYATKK